MESFRKAYGALKDSTTVGLAKVNSEFKDLDIAIVKATNHVEYPPKERHVRKIFAAVSISRPRADVAYCIHALSRRLGKTRNWIVAIKILIVTHRTLREGDPSFREELLHYSKRGHLFQISNFKDDSSPLAWDCSAWVRTYSLFLEERLECFRTLNYDIESDRVSKSAPGVTKAYSKTRLLNTEQLLDQLPSLQQLLYRLIGCQPEGAACHNFLIQYALALVLKESFKIYCAINDGIINLVDMFFEMPKHDAVRALSIYKRAGQQVQHLADFYGFCRTLDLARTFQFPILRQPPPSFLATMEEYIKEAPQTGSLSHKRLEYRETAEEAEKPEEATAPIEKQVEVVENKQEIVEIIEEPEDKIEEENEPLQLTQEPVDLLGLNETNPKAMELEQSNALALAIIQPGSDPLYANSNALMEIGKSSGWELALVTAPSNINKPQAPETRMAGGFDKLLLDSLYEDNSARRQLQLHGAGYSTSYGYEMAAQNATFDQVHDPFAMSNSIAPPTNVQMALMSQQEYMMMNQQHMMHQHQQNNMMTVQHNGYASQYYQQPQQKGTTNPFGDPFSYPQSTMQHNGSHMLI
ncbi:clathrin assembly protein-like [Dorcoceras hygrometricum]|uniref:Clathrin assembly protein-like n=1 Tax=Dorcoceras hygrometricum TaxID=472368 RepID=A0A2Z7CVZ7_9LAMI|nr:clathrin assembly protein-like [Dorcoceras hygrometricum]